MTCFLGIDTSTTGSKALIINENGEVLASASSSHTLQMPKPLWSEQNPAEWWRAVSVSIRSVLKSAGINGERIGAVGLTGQMHGLVLLDEAGNILRPAILWNDQRTQRQCEEIHQIIGRERFIQITGNAALTGFTAPKILWVKENEPDIYARIKHILLPKDYIRYKLTGEYAMDKAGAAGTVLFDLKSRNWSEEVLEADTSRMKLPHLQG
jgi:xylulokinase